MNAFAHRENGHTLRPRHPIVCLLDIVGVTVAIGLVIIYRPSLATAVLPLTIALQYVASGIHHWLPYSDVRSKFDRSVIFLVIGATYVPYWAGLLPAQEALHRLPWVAVLVVVGLILLFSGVSGRIIGIFCTLFASAGLVISFTELQQWLPPVALTVFWIGTMLYGVQQVVFGLKRPDPIPGLFGYREVQHVLLLAATTIGSIVALQYT